MKSRKNEFSPAEGKTGNLPYSMKFKKREPCEGTPFYIYFFLRIVQNL